MKQNVAGTNGCKQLHDQTSQCLCSIQEQQEEATGPAVLVPGILSDKAVHVRDPLLEALQVFNSLTQELPNDQAIWTSDLKGKAEVTFLKSLMATGSCANLSRIEVMGPVFLRLRSSVPSLPLAPLINSLLTSSL